MNFNRIQATEVKLWDFSAYFWNTPRTLCKSEICEINLKLEINLAKIRIRDGGCSCAGLWRVQFTGEYF